MSEPKAAPAQWRKHTPGPWEWIDVFVYGNPRTGPNKTCLVGPPRDPNTKPYPTDSSEHVLYCEPDGDLPSEANRDLITAAPELAEALLAAPDFGGEPTTAFGHVYREWQQQARAALRKAGVAR